jgi:hypothetical protein
MHTKDLLTTLDTGKGDLDLTIETTWSEESVIEDVDAVRSGDDYDTCLIVEAIHLSEKLVDGLFTLVVGRHATSRALLTNSINLIDENDTGLIGTSLFEKLTDSLSTHTYEHLHEVRGGALDEGDIGLTSDGSSEEGLTRTRCTSEKGATGDLSTTSKVALRLLEKVHNLLEFLLGGVDTLNIREACSDFLLHREFSGLDERVGHTSTTSSRTKESSEEGEEIDANDKHDTGLSERHWRTRSIYENFSITVDQGFPKLLSLDDANITIVTILLLETSEVLTGFDDDSWEFLVF